MKLRVGLIGLGDTWQQRHARALRTLADQFEVRAVCDQVAQRAELAAAEFSASAVDGYHALVEREDVDALLILSPQWFGALPILAACRSGKAIYCAAGLDLGPEEALAVKQRVEASGIIFMVELPRRHAPATVRLKELIATRLGRPRLLFCHRRCIETAHNHLSGCSRAHSAVRDLIELVDWCGYIVDRPPRWVYGLMYPGDVASGEEDYQMMSLDFSPPEQPGNGPIAQISCGRYIPPRWHEALTYRPLAGLQVSCENGVAFVDLPSTLVWFDEAGRHQESLESERPVGEQLLARFHRAVAGGGQKTCDLEDAYRSLTIVQQARQSHREGRRLELGD